MMKWQQDGASHRLVLDLVEFDQHQVMVSTDANGYVIVYASHSERNEQDGYVSRSLTARIRLPVDAVVGSLRLSGTDADGHVTVSVDRDTAQHRERIIPVLPAKAFAAGRDLHCKVAPGGP